MSPPANLAWLACAIAVGLSLAGGAAAQDKATPRPNDVYFPRSLWTTLETGCGTAWKPTPVMTDFRADWYGGTLRAAQERPLVGPGERGGRTYRFTWMPSFQASAVIRVDRRADGSARLTAKRLSNTNGHPPEGVADTLSRPLTPTEARDLDRLLASTAVFAQPAALCTRGTDGARWLLEANEAGAYHFVDRWSPTDGPVFEVGRFLLDLTGWTFREIY